MRIYVAAIDHRSGTNHYAANTREQLNWELADYCRQEWDKEWGEMPHHDAEVIDAYFERHSMYGEEWLSTAEIDVPVLPGAQ